MKKIALCLAGIMSPLLLTAPLLHAVEQKSVFNTENLEYMGGTGAERCRDKCDRRSGGDVKALLAQGWKIVGSTPKKIIAEDYWFTPCSSCQPHGCVCIGTEYSLRRDTPPPKAELPGREACPAHTVVPPEVQQSKGEAVAGGADLLRQENESLKRENEALKREIEGLKSRLQTR